MGRLFGTDGVRGVANQELTAELALALGAAAARRLAATPGPGRRFVVIGRDPRASGGKQLCLPGRSRGATRDHCPLTGEIEKHRQFGKRRDPLRRGLRRLSRGAHH